MTKPTTTPTILALDFGTTNSLLAAAAPGQVFDPVALDPTAPDPSILRSALHFTTAEDVVFGQAALQRYIASGLRGRLLRSIKRHLSSAAFDSTRIGTKKVTIEEIVATILRVMRETACRVFDADIDRVLLGRPARFSESANEDALAEARLAQAARIAGFREIWFCYEPVAAAYDFAEHFDQTRTVLIGDFGGGTSDFTVLRMRPGEFATDDVLAVGGIAKAGDAFDGSLVRTVVAPLFGSLVPYKVPSGSNLLTMPGDLLRLLCSPARLTLADRAAVLRALDTIGHGLVHQADNDKLGRYQTLVADAVGFQFYEAVESSKVALSDREGVRLVFDYPGIELDHPITRTDLERALDFPLGQIHAALDRTLASAGLAASDIEIACLTGGTSLVPLLESSLRKKLSGAQIVRLRSHHSVVQGLARCARALEEGTGAAGVLKRAEAAADMAPPTPVGSRRYRKMVRP
jgi:hypothetical chaperone protein